MRSAIRRWFAVIRTTALEMSSEPLALVLTLGAVVTVSVTSSLHLHQFGEPSRMSRDAGLSAMLVFGIFYAVFCTIKVFRREIESGTLQMALSHPISRQGFFFSKVMGAMLSYLVFAATVFAVTITTVIGSEVGALIALRKGDIPLVWSTCIWLDAAVVLIPLVMGALLDRFAHCRFTTSATWTAVVSAGAALIIAAFTARSFCAAEFPELDFGILDTAKRLVPAAVTLVLPMPVFVLAAAAFSVRFKDNAAAALSGLVALAALPMLSNYYLSDALAKRGTVPWTHVAVAAAATVPFLVAFALTGYLFFRDRDVG